MYSPDPPPPGKRSQPLTGPPSGSEPLRPSYTPSLTCSLSPCADGGTAGTPWAGPHSGGPGKALAEPGEDKASRGRARARARAGEAPEDAVPAPPAVEAQGSRAAVPTRFGARGRFPRRQCSGRPGRSVGMALQPATRRSVVVPCHSRTGFWRGSARSWFPVVSALLTIRSSARAAPPQRQHPLSSASGLQALHSQEERSPDPSHTQSSVARVRVRLLENRMPLRI